MLSGWLVLPASHYHPCLIPARISAGGCRGLVEFLVREEAVDVLRCPVVLHGHVEVAEVMCRPGAMSASSSSGCRPGAMSASSSSGSARCGRPAPGTLAGYPLPYLPGR